MEQTEEIAAKFGKRTYPEAAHFHETYEMHKEGEKVG